MKLENPIFPTHWRVRCILTGVYLRFWPAQTLTNDLWTPDYDKAKRIRSDDLEYVRKTYQDVELVREKQ